MFRWLLSESSGKWLLILDNADDVSFVRPDHSKDHAAQHEFTMAQYLPQRDGGAILITSRDKHAAFALAGKSNCILRVEPMSQSEAKTLIDKKIPPELGTSNERDSLASKLEYIPLAITQAAAYITRRERMTIAKYMHYLEIDEEEASLLKMEDLDLRRDPGVPNSVIKAWQITFQQIRTQNDLSANLLSCMSMFDKQGIPEFLLREIGEGVGYEEAIETLLGYAVIAMEDNRIGFAMHRLIQLATRDWLRRNGEWERQVEAAVGMLARSYPTGNYENWVTCQILEPHAESVLKNKDLSDDARLARASILRNRAWYNREQGKYRVSETMAEQAMYDRVDLLGREHSDTLASMSNLALTYWNQGRWKEAEELNVQAMETRKRVLGMEYPDTLTSMSNLALTYWNQGRWKEAEELDVQVMETRKRVLGMEHPDTLTSMGNLASTFWDQGRWKEAEELEVQVVEIRKRVLGADHPNTLTSVAILASTLSNQGRWKEAEELEVQVLEARKRVLGVEHPDTLGSIGNLASTYFRQGQWKEAEELFAQAMVIQTRVLGAEHPTTLINMSNLGWIYLCQGRSKEAEELERQILEARMRVLGTKHPNTLTSMNHLSNALESQGRYREAAYLMEECFRLRSDVLGPNDPDTKLSELSLVQLRRRMAMSRLWKFVGPRTVGLVFAVSIASWLLLRIRKNIWRR